MIAPGAGSGRSSRPTAACRPRRCSRASSSARRAGRRNPNGPERAGKFELADRGTILLDEIENASPALQARLLGMLESGEFQRVGDTRMIQSDARLIAAANTPLEEAVARGRFREDLYRRVSTLKLRLLPLRERVADIPLLARQFLQHFALLHGRRVRGISPNALECLVHYPWPGNVRELRHVIEHAVVLARGEMLMTEHLPSWVLCAKPFPAEAQPRRAPRPLREAMHEPERQWIMRALNVSGWNKRQRRLRAGDQPFDALQEDEEVRPGPA